jgi:hypothetical protein
MQPLRWTLALCLLALPVAPVYRADAAPKPAAPAKLSLSGRWVGNLSGEQGSLGVDETISTANYLLFEYQNSKGNTHYVELNHVGQVHEWAPPGGGVSAVFVEALSSSPRRLAMTLRSSFEKTTNGYITQLYGVHMVELVRIPQGVRAAYATSTADHFGDTDSIVSGGSLAKYEGLLQAAPITH